MKISTSLLLFILLFFASPAISQSNKELEDIFSSIDSISRSYLIDNPIWRGQHPTSFPFQTIDNQKKEIDELKSKLVELKSISNAEISEQNRINKQIKILELENSISRIDYQIYLIPFNSEGGFLSLIHI